MKPDGVLFSNGPGDPSAVKLLKKNKYWERFLFLAFVRDTICLASGLSTSGDLRHIVDMDTQRSVPLLPRQPVDLFIGVFSISQQFQAKCGCWENIGAVFSSSGPATSFETLLLCRKVTV